jgi:hypothetical protein
LLLFLQAKAQRNPNSSFGYANGSDPEHILGKYNACLSLIFIVVFKISVEIIPLKLLVPRVGSIVLPLKIKNS